MTKEREEAIAYFKDMNECTYGNVEYIQMAIKALEQESCEDWYDVPSDEMTLKQARQAVRDLRKFVMNNHILPKLQPCEDVIHRDRTVQDFADKCKECGAIYGKYKDFCKFVAEMVLRDDFEENAGANAEIICRELSKLGIVKADEEDEWVLREMESEE